MKKQKILYSITIEDVQNVSKENGISFTEKDVTFIEEKIGDFIGSFWHDAVEYALQELKK